MDNKSFPTSKERLNLGDSKEQKESIHSLQGGAESLEQDKNREALVLMHRLDSWKKPEEQMEGLSVLMPALTSVIAEVKRQGGDMEKIHQHPNGLLSEVNKLNLSGKLDRVQMASLDTFARMLKEGGPSTNYIAQSWEEYVNEGEAAGGNIAEKLIHQVKENPVRTVAIATAAGIGLWALWKWMKSDGEEAEEGSKEGGKSVFSKRNMLGAAFVVSLLTGIDIKKRLEEFWKMMDLKGQAKEKVDELRGKVEEHVKAGKAIPPDLQAEIRETMKEVELKEGSLEDEDSHRDRLAEMRSEIESGSEAVAEELDANSYSVGKNLFVEMYFYQREFFGADKKNKIKDAMDELNEVSIGEVNEVYEKYKSKGEIPAGSFDGKTSKLSEKHRFQLVEGLVRLNKMLQNKENLQVKQLFELAAGDTLIGKTKHFSEKMKEAVSSGNYSALLSMEIPFSGKDMEKMAEDVSKKLGLDIQSLNTEEKRVFLRIQTALLAQGSLVNDARASVSKLPVEGKDEYPRAAEMAVSFFEKVKESTATLLPKLHERFGVETEDRNWLKEGVTLDKISLRHAAQLVTIEGGEPHWTKDLMTLNILLSSFSDKSAKNQYMANVTSALADDVEVPEGLKRLKPYLESIVEVGINSAFGKGLSALEWAHGMVGHHPSARADFAELAKKSPFISFGKEAMGTALEMSMDSAAIMLGLLGVSAEELASVADGQGQDFLDLLVSRGGNIGYDKNTGIMMIEAVGKYFVVRPGRTIKETLGSMVDGDFDGAAKVWAVGSSSFVTIGAVAGFFRHGKDVNGAPVVRTIPARILSSFGGGAKGLAWPYYAPKTMIDGGRAGMKMLKSAGNLATLPARATATAIIGAKEYGTRPLRSAKETLRWGSDVMKYKRLGDMNIANMVDDANLMEYYERASKLSDRGLRGLAQEAMHDKATLMRRFAGKFNEKMAIRYAERFAERYNKLMVGHKLDIAKIRGGDLELAKTTFLRMQRAFRNIPQQAKMLDELVKNAGKYSNEAGAEKISKAFQKLGFYAEEADAMAEECRTKGDLSKMVQRLREGGKHLDESEALTKASKAAKVADGAADTARAASPAKAPKAATKLRAAGETAEDMAKMGRGMRLLRGLGVAAGGAGTLFSAWSAVESGYEAATTDVDGRAAIEGGRAAMWTVDAVAGGLVTAGLLGAKGAAVTVGGALAAPLVPLTYMGNAGFETAKNRNLTTAEWLQKRSYKELFHEWQSGHFSVGLGDAVIGTVELYSMESFDRSQQETMKKLYKVLLCAQGNPNILNILQQESPSKEKDAKLERMIEETYSPYHEYYFNHAKLSIRLAESQQDARQLIADALVFDEIMKKRDAALEAGETELKIGYRNILEDKYAVDKDGNGPEFGMRYLIEDYKKGFNEEIKEASPQLSANLERMDTAYLLRLYIQMNKALNNEGNREFFEGDNSVPAAFALHMDLIRRHLIYNRQIDFEVAVREHADFYKYDTPPDRILDNLEGLQMEESPNYEAYEEKIASGDPAVFGLYRLAEYLGYSGDRNEEGLKTFFTEESAASHGIYWDGDEWYLQERGIEMDDSMGSQLNGRAILKMITTMRQNPDDILEHRNDTFALDAKDFSKQVLEMADILEKGYREGQKRKSEKAEEPADGPLAMTL